MDRSERLVFDQNFDTFLTSIFGRFWSWGAILGSFLVTFGAKIVSKRDFVIYVHVHVRVHVFEVFGKILTRSGCDFGRFWLPKTPPDRLSKTAWRGLEVDLFLHVISEMFWIASKTAQEGPRGAQEAPGSLQERPKRAQEASKSAPGGSKRASRDPKSRSRGLKTRPRSRKSLPRRLQKLTSTRR